jgi:uncharacterized membrane protein HdeD (DUF308 family)
MPGSVRSRSSSDASGLSTHSSKASTLYVIVDKNIGSPHGKNWGYVRNGMIGLGVVAAVAAIVLFSLSHREFCLATTGGLLALTGAMTLYLNDDKKKEWKRLGWGLIGLGVVAGVCALWTHIMGATTNASLMEKIGFGIAGASVVSILGATVAHKQKKWWEEEFTFEATTLKENTKDLSENDALVKTAVAREIKLRNQIFLFTAIPTALLIILGVGSQLLVKEAGWNFTDLQANSLQTMACNLWLAAAPLGIIGGLAYYLKHWWEKKGEEHYNQLLEPSRTAYTAQQPVIKPLKDGKIQANFGYELVGHIYQLTTHMQAGNTYNVTYDPSNLGVIASSLKGQPQQLEVEYQMSQQIRIKNVATGLEVVFRKDVLHIGGYSGSDVQTNLKAVLTGSSQ